jgi:hypothetical protein
VLVQFRRQGQIISEQFNKIGGSSSGEYVQYDFPIVFNTSDNPDTVVIGMIAADMLSGNQPQMGGWIIVDGLHFPGGHAAIPNGGFESWDSFSYIDPDDWYYEDMIRFGYYPDPQEQVVGRTSEAQEGTYAAIVRNLFLEAVPAPDGGGFGGRLSSGSSVFGGRPSFPVYDRPQALHGYYRFAPEGSDTLEISCMLSKNGSPVGSGFLRIWETQTVYAPFTVDISYFSEQVQVDSAHIDISTFGVSGVHSASVATIDNLRFDGFAEDLGTVVSASLPNKEMHLRIYPNPGTDLITVSASGVRGSMQVDLYDVLGRPVHSSKASAGGSNVTQHIIDTSGLPTGVYIVHVVLGGVHRSARWIKH